MNTEPIIYYKGITITCPQCGRMHDLEGGEACLRWDGEPYEIWLRCPTCGLKFEGTAIAKWRRTKFKEPNKVAKNFTDIMNELSSVKKTVYTVFLLDEVNHTSRRCFRTPTDEENLGEILKRLSKTCRPGESYLAIEEVD